MGAARVRSRGSFGLFGFTYVREMELYREMGLDPVNIWDRAVDAAARMVTRKTAKRRGERSAGIVADSLY